MTFRNQRKDLARRLQGQRLVIPDMRPIFAHWPGGQNENYQAVREALIDETTTQEIDSDASKIIVEANAALLAATWWPTSAMRQYRVMADLVIWFGVWDDVIEQLGSDAEAAERLRTDTKALVRRALTFSSPKDQDGLDDNTLSNSPLARRFGGIATEVRAFLDEDRRNILIDHFDQYIDATRLEAVEEQSPDIPSLERYWAVRTLASGMGILLGFSEYALQVKVPLEIINSTLYETLWLNTIVINSIVNDLVSFKKEMKAGSVLSSVAILYHELGDDLDAAVRASLSHLREQVASFDEAAAAVLAAVPGDRPQDLEATSAVIALMRMINTGNLEWSLQAKRYGVGQYITETGDIELTL